MKGDSPAYHLVQLVVSEGVDPGPLSLLNVGLVLITKHNTSVGTT